MRPQRSQKRWYSTDFTGNVKEGKIISTLEPGRMSGFAPRQPRLWCAPCPIRGNRLYYSARSGCGAAWLARLLWEQEVAGSNPVTPIA